MRKNVSLDIHSVTLSDIHRSHNLQAPMHPLISIIDGVSEELGLPSKKFGALSLPNFYQISLKPGAGGKVRYGQTHYDFSEGGMVFAAPNQLIESCSTTEEEQQCSMYTLLVHPDFFLNYPLSKKIKQYGFFSYATNEALHLSEDEKVKMVSVFKSIQEELNSRIDDFSQDIIISHIELLLTYANRFYKRQFITRKDISNDLIQRIDDILDDYFTSKIYLGFGIPTVQYLSGKINVSPRYLSDMVRSVTGQNTQSLIHHKIIEKAKEKLSSTGLSISEVAYELGFEHPSSFTKLFKAKTNLSPIEFRKSFY
ncbi:helix-turn-helix domain-containing protein [Sphingobacterium thalpophilum]|uniref:helix-turn-helix domain-containing protein n=1 Tax=Sphingobacterium thalpophilum TaxID=259 RepID=UPI003C768446